MLASRRGVVHRFTLVFCVVPHFKPVFTYIDVLPAQDCADQFARKRIAGKNTIWKCNVPDSKSQLEYGAYGQTHLFGRSRDGYRIEIFG